MDVHGKHITVFGMAKSGRAVAALLQAHGAIVRVSDSKPLSEIGPLGFEFVQQPDAALAGCELAVLSPGVPPDQPHFQGVPLVGDVEAAGWFLRGPILAITGSNGKTTTTALTGHLLLSAGIPVQVGGNIGTPLADMVATSRDDQWNVLELSSFQLETSHTLHARIAVALNVTPDHLDRHGDLTRYAAAKARIFLNQTPADFAVLNAENEIAAGFASSTPAQIRWFHAGSPVHPGLWCESGRLLSAGVPFLDSAEIPLRGRHNVENVLAAACAAQLAGAPLSAIAAGVRSFPGVEHRIEFVRTLNGVSYYNDSKATNVDATIKALESFDSGLWVILGGKDKGSDYTALRALLHTRARAALLIGAAADKIERHLEGAVRLERCGDLRSATLLARAEARPGDTVLLAPACASFDQFTGYEQRGRAFKEFVNSLPEEPS